MLETRNCRYKLGKRDEQPWFAGSMQVEFGMGYCESLAAYSMCKYLAENTWVKTGVGEEQDGGKLATIGAVVDELSYDIGKVLIPSKKLLGAVLTDGRLECKYGFDIRTAMRASDTLTTDRGDMAVEALGLLGEQDTMMTPVAINDFVQLRGSAGSGKVRVTGVSWKLDYKAGEGAVVEGYVIVTSDGKAKELKFADMGNTWYMADLRNACQGNSEEASKMLEATKSGIVKPIELCRGFTESLIVDGSFAYHRGSSGMTMVGIWDRHGIVWEPEVRSEDCEFKDMVDRMDAAAKAIACVRWKIAPYMSVRPTRIQM